MERKRTFSWDDPGENRRDAAAVSGLDYLKAIQKGHIKPPPAARLIGYRIIDVDNGYTAFELNPGEYHYNPFSTVHGGILSTLLDSAMTASVLSTLAKGFGCATVEIKINFIRPVTEKTGPIRCEATPVHLGKRLATAEGRVKDKQNRLLAHGVSTCSIFEVN